MKNGGTQTDFTNDDSYFIAPSFRYKPDLDTSFTVLALASKDKTRVQNFLPYVGTVVNAPFGRIPTSLFASDPSVDTFTREQEMLGYQFEKNLTDDLTFRQNARFAHDDVKFQTLLGNGYVTPGGPATAQLSRFNDLRLLLVIPGPCEASNPGAQLRTRECRDFSGSGPFGPSRNDGEENSPSRLPYANVTPPVPARHTQCRGSPRPARTSSSDCRSPVRHARRGDRAYRCRRPANPDEAR